MGIRFFKLLMAAACMVLLMPGSYAIAGIAEKYGIPAIAADSIRQKQAANMLLDSIFAAYPQLASRHIVYAVEQAHAITDRTTDFYLLLFLCLVLGVIRFIDFRYFSMLWRAFINPTLSNRQLKDQLQGAGIPNLLMNLFFTMVAGAYLYFLLKIFALSKSAYPASVTILLLIGGVIGIYLIKYFVIRFSGWAFRVQDIAEQYVFNVFLINKVLSVILLPFVIIMAFLTPEWLLPIALISIIVALLMIVNRYVRSWQVFGSFFQYSRFHFFVYLCASEILPLAILVKLLMRGLLV